MPNGLSSLKIGLVQFPGSNCDQDCQKVLTEKYGVQVIPIWHTQSKLPQVAGLVIPGGFSYGDYLRAGALAAHSPVATEFAAFHKQGKPIIGICNGFQILCELGLLPGVLLANENRRFVCTTTRLQVSSGSTRYHQALAGQSLAIPVAHGEGRYHLPQRQLDQLLADQQVFLRYAPGDQDNPSPSYNPNGSQEDIAGIVSKDGKVLGLMPHPERVADTMLGGKDGLKIWDVFLELAS